MPPTPQRAVRVEDDVWDPALERAISEDRSLSSVIRIALRTYAEHGIDAISNPREKRKAR